MKILHIVQAISGWRGRSGLSSCTGLTAISEIDLMIMLLNDHQQSDSLHAGDIRVIILYESSLSGLTILIHLYRLVFKFKPAVIHNHRSKENFIAALVPFMNHTALVQIAQGDNEYADHKFNLRFSFLRMLNNTFDWIFKPTLIPVLQKVTGRLETIYLHRKIMVIHNDIDIGAVIEKVSSHGEYEHYADPLWAETIPTILENGRQDRIHTSGFVGNIAPYLKPMILLLVTSSHEGLPMTLLDDMAWRVAAMSRNSPSIKQVLCGGVCAYVLTTGQPEDISRLIIHLCSNKNDLRPKAAMTYKNLQARYSIHKIAQNYVLHNDEITSWHGKGGEDREADIVCSADCISSVMRGAIYYVVKNTEPYSLPDITHESPDGRHFVLSTLHSRPILVVFWASTCDRCNQALPALIGLHNEYASRGQELVASLFIMTTRMMRLQWLETCLSRSVLLDSDKKAIQAFRNVHYTPTIFLIAANGSVVYRNFERIYFNFI